MNKCGCVCVACGMSIINAEWKELQDCLICNGRCCNQCMDENGICGRCNDFSHDEDN